MTHRWTLRINIPRNAIGQARQMPATALHGVDRRPGPAYLPSRSTYDAGFDTPLPPGWAPSAKVSPSPSLVAPALPRPVSHTPTSIHVPYWEGERTLTSQHGDDPPPPNRLQVVVRDPPSIIGTLDERKNTHASKIARLPRPRVPRAAQLVAWAPQRRALRLRSTTKSRLAAPRIGKLQRPPAKANGRTSVACPTILVSQSQIAVTSVPARLHVLPPPCVICPPQTRGNTG